jgi:hypothetical protein
MNDVYGLPKDFYGSRLVGRFLEQIFFGLYQIQLRFDQRLTIAVTSSLAYRDSPEDPEVIEIPDLPVAKANLLQLLHHRILRSFGDQGGTLTIEFDNGHVLQCFDQPHYEAYEIRLGDEHIIV